MCAAISQTLYTCMGASAILLHQNTQREFSSFCAEMRLGAMMSSLAYKGRATRQQAPPRGYYMWHLFEKRTRQRVYMDMAVILELPHSPSLLYSSLTLRVLVHMRRFVGGVFAFVSHFDLTPPTYRFTVKLKKKTTANNSSNEASANFAIQIVRTRSHWGRIL